MRPELIKVWNVAGMEDAHIQLSNRTSNGLERYNRHMGAMFPHAHPTLILFVQTLKAEVDSVIQRMEDVKKGREKPPTYQGASFPTIPPEYDSFYSRLYGKSNTADPKDTLSDSSEFEFDYDEDEFDYDDDAPLAAVHKKVTKKDAAVKKKPVGDPPSSSDDDAPLAAVHKKGTKKAAAVKKKAGAKKKPDSSDDDAPLAAVHKKGTKKLKAKRKKAAADTGKKKAAADTAVDTGGGRVRRKPQTASARKAAAEARAAAKGRGSGKAKKKKD